MTDQPTAAPTTCYRHPDRSAGVRCQRCDRHICPSCMNTASVGFHCPECVSTGSQQVRTASSLFNARPVVTQVLIGINVAVFLLGVLMGDGLLGQVAVDGLLIEGALNAGLVSVLGDWYRIFTAGFLHYGIIHLAMNMYVLWILGPQFERNLGPVRFVLVYLAALTLGSAGALIASPNALTAGASGAIYGIFGLAVAASRSSGRSIWDNGLGMTLVINFALTFGVRSISVGGHVGGFIGGLLAGFLVYEFARQRRLAPRVIDAILAAMIIAGFGIAMVAANAA